MPGKSCAKHLLLTLPIDIVVAMAVERVKAELWNQPVWLNVRLQKVQSFP